MSDNDNPVKQYYRRAVCSTCVHENTAGWPCDSCSVKAGLGMGWYAPRLEKKEGTTR